jgi:alkylation response protein AidB-like acyl-CoA dehydrogenase
MAGLDAGRLHVAAGAVGILRACRDACVQFARQRRQFGKRIGDFQQVGAAVADMDVDLRAARLLTLHAARMRDGGHDAGEAASAAKLFATERALHAATVALQLHGSRGYTDELPIERHWRDAVALTIYEGTSQIQRVILSRALLGRDDEAGS